MPIEVYDERFTTKLAHRSGGATAEDSRAAAVLLEGWLARERSAAGAPGPIRPQAGNPDEPHPDNSPQNPDVDEETGSRRPARQPPHADHQRVLRPDRRPGRGLEVERARRAAVRARRRRGAGQEPVRHARRPRAPRGRGVEALPRERRGPAHRAPQQTSARSTRSTSAASRSRWSSSPSSSTRASTSRSSSRTSPSSCRAT